MSSFGSPAGFTIVRMLSASPEQVWVAWTEPDAMTQWWQLPDTATLPERLEADVQVGGHYKFTSVDNKTGELTTIAGIYQELEAPHHLVFTWGANTAVSSETPVVVVTLETHREGTLLHFELRGASGAPGDCFFYDGWAETLDALTVYLTSHALDTD